LVVVVAVVAFFMLEHGKKTATVTPISAAPDAYADEPSDYWLAMSESQTWRVGR